MADDNTFDRLLATGAPLVADGAMGTTLFSLGLEGGGCPELLNLEQPDLVEKVHRGFIDAGSDIILTNTFGGNRLRLALHDLDSRVAELNAAAVSIARRAVDQAGRPVAIAGSVGPTGELLAPLGTLSHEQAVEVFAEQCQALAEAGADVLWIETISSFEELEAACQGAATTSLPYTATLSFDTAGHTMMGISPRAFGEWWLNHKGPNHEGPNHQSLAALGANCGIPLYKSEGGLTYPIGPDRMGDYVNLALRAGARIIGACCGSTPDHIAAIREAVDGYSGGARPSFEEIQERLEASVLPSPKAHRPSRRKDRARLNA